MYNAAPVLNNTSVKKPKSRLRRLYGGLKAAAIIAAAAMLLVPLGLGSFRYFTSPQNYMNYNEFEKAKSEFSGTERRMMIDDLVSVGRFGKAYDIAQDEEKEEIFLLSQVAYYTREAYNLMEEDLGYAVDASECSLTAAYHCYAAPYEIFVIVLDDYYYYFFGDDGNLLEYNRSYSEDELERKLGIKIFENSSGGYDNDSVLYPSSESKYIGANLGYVVNYIKAAQLFNAGMKDNIEYLGRDKMPQ